MISRAPLLDLTSKVSYHHLFNDAAASPRRPHVSPMSQSRGIYSMPCRRLSIVVTSSRELSENETFCLVRVADATKYPPLPIRLSLYDHQPSSSEHDKRILISLPTHVKLVCCSFLCR
ncbi:hypothetical protein CY34DRAFT_617802 [Suillus luteus UH-Slu-Lm8-n1]|uniref:Uncharacterized protein n=1 Tax=Suillus luteus UH-Slu-Lm8-n1 TaxID=930992 RepID=A0A0D0ARZ8_9AGAM|nr:hypothetical protein CY34DRAFT_617802 [Suillus luteus UH-Slu-Lm8-n1]